MPSINDQILFVESDPGICDLISRQSLQPLGYQVIDISAADKAMQQVIKFTPDLIISKINQAAERRESISHAIKILCTDPVFQPPHAIGTRD